MNADLVEKWNRQVKPTDTIYHLGDFGFSHSKREPLADIFARLDGKKHLVVGNHDEKNPKVMKLPWESVKDLVTIRDNDIRAVACHYPMETWKQAHHGYLMLHGHSHGSLKRVLPHRFDVGVDVFKDGPVPLVGLDAMAKNQTFEATDHHAENL